MLAKQKKKGVEIDTSSVKEQSRGEKARKERQIKAAEIKTLFRQANERNLVGASCWLSKKFSEIFTLMY